MLYQLKEGDEIVVNCGNKCPLFSEEAKNYAAIIITAFEQNKIEFNNFPDLLVAAYIKDKNRLLLTEWLETNSHVLYSLSLIQSPSTDEYHKAIVDNMLEFFQAAARKKIHPI